MRLCTFLADASPSLEALYLMEDIIIDLIENEHVTAFELRRYTDFDQRAEDILQHLWERYPHIHFRYWVKAKPYELGYCESPLQCITSTDVIIAYVTNKGGPEDIALEQANAAGVEIFNLAHAYLPPA